MRYFWAILFLSFNAQAYADSVHLCQGKSCNDNETGMDQQSQTQSVEQHQQQSQDQSLTGGDNSATGGVGGNSTADGGSSSIGDISTNITNKRAYRNSPTVIAPNVYPSGPCFGGKSGSASWPGFGVSVGGGKIDTECNDREWVRTSPESHKLFVYCSSDYMKGKFPSVEECLDYVPKGGDEPDDGGLPIQNPRHDTAVLRQEVEAALSAVREELRQTKVEVGAAQRRARNASPSPYEQTISKLSDVAMVK